MAKAKEEKVGMSEEEVNAAKQEELNKRVQAFNSELLPLLGKYHLGLGASAYLTPDGKVNARPVMFDDVGKKKEVANNDTDIPSV